MGIMKAVGQGLLCIREPAILAEDELSADERGALSSSSKAPGKCGRTVAVMYLSNYMYCVDIHIEK